MVVGREAATRIGCAEINLDVNAVRRSGKRVSAKLCRSQVVDADCRDLGKADLHGRSEEPGLTDVEFSPNGTIYMTR